MRCFVIIAIFCFLITLSQAERPACWDCPCQPYGDTNCDGLIAAMDIQALYYAWMYGDYPCADFNQDGLITAIDVQIILKTWSEGGAPGCPLT